MLVYSRQVHENSRRSSGASSSSTKIDSRVNGDDFDRTNAHIRSQIAQLDAEIIAYRADISELENQILLREDQKRVLESQLAQANNRVDVNGKGKGPSGINYQTADFEWSDALRARMKAVFGINDFRLCQRGYVALLDACNATKKATVSAMPTWRAGILFA